MPASFRSCGPRSHAAGRRLLVRVTALLRTGHRPLLAGLPEAHACGCLSHPQDARGHARDDGVGRHVARDDRARADHGVVADRHAAQDAGSVADPHVVAHAHVALVDALEPDRPVHLDHSVVEVDQHHAVGDHALATDRDVLVRGDRALLPDHGLRADRDRALVAADLAAMPHPGPAPQLERGPRPHLDAASGTHEREPVEPQARAQPQLEEAQPDDQPAVLQVQHPVPSHEAEQGEEAAPSGRRRTAQLHATGDHRYGGVRLAVLAGSRFAFTIACAMTRTVLIVDDHPSFRASARMLLEAEGYSVVGEAEDGLSALRAVEELDPDVVLLDVQLPDIDGIEVAARLTANGSAPAIVLTSSRDLADLGPVRDRCDVRGFIPKAELSGAGFALGVIVAAAVLTSDHTNLRGAVAVLGLVVGWGFIGTGLFTWARR